MSSYTGTVAGVNKDDVLYILPFHKEDVYYIYPLLGMGAADDRDKHLECLDCKQLLYTPFSLSELGTIDIVVSRNDGPIYRKSDDISITPIEENSEEIAITFFGRSIDKFHIKTSSISMIDGNVFELRVRDIRVNKIPKHICSDYYE